jgi:hypothetical protein
MAPTFFHCLNQEFKSLTIFFSFYSNILESFEEWSDEERETDNKESENRKEKYTNKATEKEDESIDPDQERGEEMKEMTLDKDFGCSGIKKRKEQVEQESRTEGESRNQERIIKENSIQEETEKM